MEKYKKTFFFAKTRKICILKSSVWLHKRHKNGSNVVFYAILYKINNKYIFENQQNKK